MTPDYVYDVLKRLESLNCSLETIIALLGEVKEKLDPWYIRLYKYVKGVL